MPYQTFEQANEAIININDRLSDSEKELRIELIHHFITEHPKTIFYCDTYQSLLKKHIFKMDDKQRITSLYPFSTTKTNKRVSLKQQEQPFYAMCAIDAIGIHFTLHQAITIQSECELTKTPISFEMIDGKAVIDEKYADIRILHTDLSDISDWASTCCSQMHFFLNQESLEKWVDQYGCNKQIYYSLTLDEAIVIAKKLFYTI